MSEPASDPEPEATPEATTPATPAPAAGEPATDAKGRPIATGRYIVLLDPTADTASVITRHGKRDGVKADRRFDRAVRAFSAKLDAGQRQALRSDPSVVAVVPDEVIGITAQTTPTGVSRVGARLSATANIDNVDERVTADVAIVDTGVAMHPDLNVVGGVNCSTSDRSAWQDQNGHGTHVAGTVAAIDNTTGVVGVAPGARIWAVRILNADGYGLLSWYVCGLDWILAQRDPLDASLPRIEAVNMSVAKSGSDDRNCGLTNKDVLHQAICRLYKGGITVVAAAANESGSAAGYVPAAYNEVITVSALADTDGKSGGLGGNRCFSWGTYDVDDTFADFSNFGSDVDIIAPGKCIWSTIRGPSYGYSSGTSMAAPAVTGAVALYKASRPRATPTEVRASLRYLGNFSWKTSTDPDSIHEPLLDVHRVAALGTFRVVAPTTAFSTPLTGATIAVPVTLNRSSSFFERVRLSFSDVPAGWSATLAETSLFGWTAKSTTATFNIPSTAKAGTYKIKVVGTNWGRTSTSTITVQVGAMPFTDVNDFDVQIEWLYQAGSPAAARRRSSARRARSPAPRWRCSSTVRSLCPRRPSTISTTTTARPAKAASTPWPRPRSPAAAARAASARRPRSRAPRWRCSWTALWPCPTPRPTTSTTTTGGPARAASMPWRSRPSPVAAAQRRYCPTSSVTREQMAAFLYRAHLQGRLD